MASATCMHCERCERDVAVVYRYSATMRRWWKAYFLIPPMVLIPLSPFLAGDYVVTLPIMMVYMLGFGPALSIIRDPPTCADCGALVQAKRA